MCWVQVPFFLDGFAFFSLHWMKRPWQVVDLEEFPVIVEKELSSSGKQKIKSSSTSATFKSA